MTRHGFGCCEPEPRTDGGTWNLRYIGVLPDHQGRGIGSAMIRYVEDILLQERQNSTPKDGEDEVTREVSARILLVELLGTLEWDRTRQFFETMGFVEEARIRDYYQNGGDKLIFWKRLSNESSQLLLSRDQ